MSTRPGPVFVAAEIEADLKCPLADGVLVAATGAGKGWLLSDVRGTLFTGTPGTGPDATPPLYHKTTTQLSREASYSKKPQ